MIVLKKALGRYLLLTLFALLFFGFGARAQELTITGKIVAAEDGLGIPGVSVIIKGTTTGTVSNMDGMYSLNANMGDVLHFSFIGMQAQLITVTKEIIDVSMSADVVGLEEVIAIGYGTTTKRKMVGSVANIDAETMERSTFTNITEALQGQVAGLVVGNSGGSPGDTPTISIRGGGTPLFVIDGAISSAYEFSVLNKEDIESISFLKDASATAVYGSKAGNGIILVTTKRGKKGAPVLRYSTSTQLSEATYKNTRASATKYATAVNEIYTHDTGANLYSDEVMAKIINQTDTENYPDNDFVELALNDYATTTKQNVSISGGGEFMDYYMSLGYMDQGSIYKQDVNALKRYTARTNLTSHFDEIGLEVGLNINASLQNLREPYDDQWSSLFFITSPLQAAYNEDGTYASGTLNPLPYIDEDAGYSKTRKKYVTTQLSAKWAPKFIKGLTAGFKATYDDKDYLDKDWVDVADQYYSDGSLQAKSFDPSLTVTSGYSYTLDVQSNVNYIRTFGEHTLDGTFVFNARQGESSYVSGYRTGYLSDAVEQLSSGSTSGELSSGTETESASEGYVFRLKYDYKSRYILEFSGRYDGNDNFADGQKWGFFPAVAGVWILSDEPFMNTLQDKNIVNNLKLRASYGEIGITGDTRFPYLSGYSIADDDESYVVDGELVNGLSEGNLVDAAAVTWYSQKTTNLGFDFGTLNNRLQGSLDYFYYRTTGYLMSAENVYSDPLGKDLPETTSDTEFRKEGFEVLVNWKDVWGKLKYSIGCNISYFNEMYSQLDSEDASTLQNPYTRLTHQKDYYGIDDSSSDGLFYISDGLFQSTEDILNSPKPASSTNTQCGDITMVREEMI
jgi:TonB-linked SusC/RagA family outer membrane protein